ncbi:MAG: lipopolysaccharide biosynthesis protein [Vicinamibacterales bacterium]
MSRLRRAAVAATFSYLQYAVAMVSGIALVPLTLHHLGARSYGLWLATGELLGYAAMVDLGVLGVLPWMLAEADGRRDRDGLRALVANGVALGAVAGAGYVLLVSGLWLVLPWALGLGQADRDALFAPLALLVAVSAIVYPLRVFNAILAGLQDVAFSGLMTLAQSVVAVGLTVVLLLRGHGLLALAAASAASALLSAFAAVIRVSILAPDLLRGWPRPSLDAIARLLANGVGGWFGTFGWQLLAASNGLVITMLGRPEWVAVWACTAKLTSMATQLTWVMPDAGLVGLAQVHGEAQGADRLRSLVTTLLRMHLLLAGGAACGLLAANPAFVVRWVGADLFGGLALNTVLAAGIVAFSLVHGVLTTASVVGHRVRVGALTLVNGVIQVVAAVVLGRIWGLPGIALAGLAAGLIVAVPAGVVLLRPATALTLRTLTRELFAPWAARASAPLLFGWAAGLLYRDAGLAGGLVLGALAGVAYVWHMRPFYVGLPFDARISRWLVSLRLMPAPSPLERA